MIWLLLSLVGAALAGIYGGLIGTVIGAGFVLLSLYTGVLGLIGGAIGGALRT